MTIKTKINHLKDLFLEVIFRIKNRSNYFKFKYNGHTIKLFLPNWGDYLQQHWIVKKSFSEEEYLNEISRFIPENAVILDIGSNIGNHTIYFGKILKAKKIYCFEPHREIFKILKKNIELNSLDKITELNNFACGSRNSGGGITYDGIKKKFSNWYKRNMGGTTIRIKDKGEIIIKKLDSLGFKEKIDFLKIDTEGFELEVLKGAKKILKKHNPNLYIEIDNSNKKEVFYFLDKIGYKLIKKFPGRNYFFIKDK